MAKVKADLTKCRGYANCVAAADDYFDIDDDDLVIVLKEDITDEARERVEKAVRSCPVSALRIEE